MELHDTWFPLLSTAEETRNDSTTLGLNKIRHPHKGNVSENKYLNILLLEPGPYNSGKNHSSSQVGLRSFQSPQPSTKQERQGESTFHTHTNQFWVAVLFRLGCTSINVLFLFRGCV